MPLPELQISVTKRKDGFAVLSCIRSDGSVTWQKQRGQFFAYHDLIHYAVESELGATHGFFGLIAAGWDIHDTTGKGARGTLPSEALRVELIVGLIAADLTTGGAATAEDLAEQGRAYGRAQGVDADVRLDQSQLDRIRATIKELHSRWASTGSSEALTLVFPRRALSSGTV